MTTQELREIISKSKNAEWFNSLEFTIANPKIEYEKKFKGITSFHEFLSDQVKGWEKYKTNLLTSSKNWFIATEEKIERFVNQNSSKSSNYLLGAWNREISSGLSNQSILPYSHPIRSFLIDLAAENRSACQAAYDYFFTNNYSLSNKDSIAGMLLAYEFDRKGKTDLTRRRRKEQKAMDAYHVEWDEKLNEAEASLMTYFKKSEDTFKDHAAKIDELTVDKEVFFRDWFEGNSENEGIKTVFQNWFDGDGKEGGVKKELEKIKKTYEDKLKLSAPAEYWNKRAKELNTHGWWSLGVTVLFVGIVVFSLGRLLWKAPEEIYHSFFGEDKSAAIRWSIIYITFISFVAFCIRALIKVMFSSFHLARDCEERYTLTYFYLSLTKESEVSQEDRQLVMQSLFSRADTGLLKDDSGPTMPNDIVGKLIGPK